jgi:serine protease Do
MSHLIATPFRLWPALLPAVLGLGCLTMPDPNAPGSPTDACNLFAELEPADGSEPAPKSRASTARGEAQSAEPEKDLSAATLALLASRSANEARRAEAKVRDAGRPTGDGAKELEAVIAAIDDGALELEHFLEIERTEGPALADVEERFAATWGSIADYCKARKGLRECADVIAIEARPTHDEVVAIAKNADSFSSPILKKQLHQLIEIDDEADVSGRPLREALGTLARRLKAARKREEAAREAMRSACGGALRPRFGPAEVVAAPSGDPRTVVVVVETHPGPALAKGIDGAAAAVTHGPRPTAAAGFGSGFGSGFLVVRNDGSDKHTYVVTNRHVVEAGDIAVKNEQGERLPDAEVIYEDPFADLAVIGFGEDPGVKGGLAIANRPAKDGDAVVVLGFPGIGNAPAYQMTRGNISNERLRVEGTRFLQHTAPTDPGSSGGPLLNAEGRVVGVASGKARDREAVSIAVPRAELIEALDRAADTERRRDEEGFRRASLYDSCLLAVSSAEEGWDPPQMLFSRALVEEQGIVSFAKILEKVPEKRRQALAELWRHEPIHAIHLAIGARLVSALRIDAAIHPTEACRGARDLKNLSRTDSAEVTLQGRAKSIKLRFVFERGRYKLRAF